MADAATFIASAYYDSASSSSGTCNKPTGTVDNDLMFAFVFMSASKTVNSVPSGWTELGTNTDATTGVYYLYYKLASSEGSSYTWGTTGASRLSVTIVTYRGGFYLTSPIDAVSNTQYVVNNTTIRAASMSASMAAENLLFFAATNNTGYTPSTPTTQDNDWTQDDAKGSTASWFYRRIYSSNWSGSGATGVIDSTASGTTTYKHAFAVALDGTVPETSIDADLTDPLDTLSGGPEFLGYLTANIVELVDATDGWVNTPLDIDAVLSDPLDFTTATTDIPVQIDAVIAEPQDAFAGVVFIPFSLFATIVEPQDVIVWGSLDFQLYISVAAIEPRGYVDAYIYKEPRVVITGALREPSDDIATTVRVPIQIYVAVIEPKDSTDSTANVSMTMVADLIEAADILTATLDFVINLSAAIVEPNDTVKTTLALLTEKKVIVLNVLNNAVSEYTGYNFDFIIEMNGKYYGVIFGFGTYLLEGVDDAGVPISTLLQTGLSDFGSAYLKNVPDLFVSGAIDGQVQGRTVTDGNTYSNPCIVTGDGSLQTKRLKFPIGRFSRYWGWEIANLEGGVIPIDTLEIEPNNTNRKIS